LLNNDELLYSQYPCSLVASVRQWRRELLDKTTLPEDAIAEYSGESKQTAPVTLATYQILSYRSSKDGVPAFPTVQRSLMGLDYLRRSSPVATHFPDYRRTARRRV